ncbi:uncharacterized protein TNCT_227451 [Trichonephila clavata]|uniref:Uncharacterized protein n=1 Tax=Trichonephila clavata TaxID=2740835 RepID=A0A8X6FMQ8_TRICU|nr:uncharacterized protein TNCT_227451 [Trichonephila clavata]
MKVFSVVALLFVGLGATIATHLSDCSGDQCEEFSPMRQLNEIRKFPNKEQLAVLCPIAFKYIECTFDTIKECTGIDIEELMLNESLSEWNMFLVSMESLLVDLCDEDSSFHKDYIASADCVWRVIDEEPNPECELQGIKRGREFLNATGISPEDMDENQRAEINCLEMPAIAACITSYLQRHCGEAARRAVLHVVREFKPLIQQECSSDNVLKLKRDFLDYLNLEDEEKHAYHSVFEILKRR